jgi:hypothetical protein
MCVTGASPQTLCNTNAEISYLVASGNQIEWYDSSIGGNLLPANTAVNHLATYYASQTIGSCVSLNRLAVSVNLISCEMGLSSKGVLTSDPSERLDRYGHIGNPLEYVSSEGKINYLGAYFAIASVPDQEIVGVLNTTGITLELDYNATRTGLVAAYRSTLEVSASNTLDGVGGTIEFTIPLQTILATGNGKIQATMKALSHNLNFKNENITLGTLSFPKDHQGTTDTFNVLVKTQ